MAGDWIKMRTDLYRDPKVCVMADLLMAEKSELSRYVNQNMQRNMTVTRNVMRNVTVGALVSTWGVLRHRGKRQEDDLMLKGCTLAVIDDVSEIPGFGEAMLSVGWVVQAELGLVFPNFFEEFNVDPEADFRRKNADRQRRFREKQASKNNANSNVTVTSESNVREEKRREESKQSPLPPSRKRGAVEFKTWMDSCKAAGEKPISEYRAIFDYAESIRLPVDFLQLAWAEFSRRHSPGGVDCRKKKSDWRAYFRKAVEGNWYHLWFHDVSTDQFSLTSNGRAAERATA
jgi:hypothetical protein